MNMLPMFSTQRLKVDFCTGSGLEPGGHYVHEGTTLLSHQQLRGRLGGEVSITTRTIMMMSMMMAMMSMRGKTCWRVSIMVWCS